MKKTLYTALFALSGMFWASNVYGQQDPTRIGAGQLPYIMIILDTSGSMEWTDQGDERYPEFPGPNSEWVPGDEMGLDPSNPSAGPSRFGSCFVWEPQGCNNYRRPGWRINSNLPDWGWNLINAGGQGHLLNRWRAIRGDTHPDRIRLAPDSQPRHVTMKEVLTGDMVLWSKQHLDAGQYPLDPTFGPGCWFVPRQRGASIQSATEQMYCNGESRFEDLPDHDEPRPHFQEVFDDQVDNGLLDVLGTSAIFAVGLLDGYREDVSGWPNGLNDNMPGSAPSSTAITRNAAASEDTAGHYNLGLYQVIGPKKLDIPNSYLAEISRHVQVALVDSGYVHRSDGDAWKLTMKKKKGKGGGVQGRPELGLIYSNNADEYLDEDVLAKQPIARATALAAAVMDARQFLQNDTRFSDDPYALCRPKQIVIVTDGYPEPEAAGGAGAGLGNDALTPAFGYSDLTKYNYATAEDEIQDLVFPGMGNPRFMTRVHVVALDSGADAATQGRIADKMSQMAIDGQTCAEYALCGAELTNDCEWLPAPHGACDPSVRACLVGGQRSYANYEPPDLDGASVMCRYPALIMSRNDRDAIQEALASTLQSIVGGAGVASRTRTVVSDFLDDDTLLGGGQYRVYSGSRIQGSAFWRGILSRETLPCDTTITNSYDEGVGITDDSGLLSQDLHADIGEQVKCGPAVGGNCSVTKADNRRIFTSIPTEDLWSFVGDMYGGSTTFDSGHPLYHFRYDLMKVPETQDEFRGTSLPAPVLNESETLGTRIPLYAKEIEDALSGVTAWNPTGLYEYFAVADGSELERLFDVHRGRTLSKATGNRDTSRVITGILNSTPVVVPPPIRDLPIESYRLFRARYGDRPTMLYSATLDGQLHAIHVGELGGRIAIRDFVEDNSWAPTADVVRAASLGASPNGVDPHQREAWTYIPNMILRQLGNNTISQPSWMDGTPVVKDVRLCQANPERNSNRQACRAIRSSAADASQYLTGDQQWRTVLVQGLGESGAGYFALDVTRPGGLRAGAMAREVDRPDPIALWELDRVWEANQAKALLGRAVASDRARIAGPDSMATSYVDAGDPDCATANHVWSRSLLGKSVSTPEIATVVVGYNDSGTDILEQRPVAVFGGGLPDGSVCGISNGSAVYVVDLQTGTILRRFVSYYRPGDVNEYSFFPEDIGFTGSPTLYDSNTGSVATRGFIGDSRGRLFKIDLSNPLPHEWRMVMAIDPYDAASPLNAALGGQTLGPASGKPSIAVGPSRELIVTYGLGEPGDVTSAGQVQAVVTFAETGPTSFPINWFKIFPEGEKMTGDPIVFNRTIYFPTYAVPPGDACAPGAARIYGVEYFNEASTTPVGVFDPADPDFAGNPDVSIGGGGLYFEIPETLIRGLTITLGPICTGRGIGDATSDLDDSRYAVSQPQLIAQTGAAPAGGMSSRHKASTGTDAIGRITHNLQRRRGPVVPLNWSLIY